MAGVWGQAAGGRCRAAGRPYTPVIAAWARVNQTGAGKACHCHAGAAASVRETTSGRREQATLRYLGCSQREGLFMLRGLVERASSKPLCFAGGSKLYHLRRGYLAGETMLHWAAVWQAPFRARDCH